MKRREFIETAILAGAGAMAGGCATDIETTPGRVPYGETIGDRLWMWGHHAMSLALLPPAERKSRHNNYGLPLERHIDMAPACANMNIPGCFVVRWRNLPTKAELPAYMKQFAATKRVGFSITDSAVESFDAKVRLGLEFADRMPNLTTLVMDDYWSARSYEQSFERLLAAKREMAVRGLKLGVVLYADVNGVKNCFKDVLDLCDEITFWFWNGKNVAGIEEQVAKLRALVGPKKAVLLGQYMWDFGGSRQMSAERMENQLAQTSRLLARKEISGVIFHCTPLVDMDLDAVNISRRWIAANASRRWGS